MNREQRIENRKFVLRVGINISGFGILMLSIASIMYALGNKFPNVFIVLVISGPLLILIGAVSPTIIMVIRNFYLKRHNLYL